MLILTTPHLSESLPIQFPAQSAVCGYCQIYLIVVAVATNRDFTVDENNTEAL